MCVLNSSRSICLYQAELFLHSSVVWFRVRAGSREVRGALGFTLVHIQAFTMATLWPTLQSRRRAVEQCLESQIERALVSGERSVVWWWSCRMYLSKIGCGRQAGTNLDYTIIQAMLLFICTCNLQVRASIAVCECQCVCVWRPNGCRCSHCAVRVIH